MAQCVRLITAAAETRPESTSWAEIENGAAGVTMLLLSVVVIRYWTEKGAAVGSVGRSSLQDF
jgi:hypothetical protein